MQQTSRRQFLSHVGQGMLAASLGTALAQDMGLASAAVWDDTQPLKFGRLEPLVALMQETPVTKLIPALMQKLESGIELKTLVAAGAMANARTFGGQDYIGFHTFMALSPAYTMAQRLPGNQQALPIFKVLYRNTQRIQDKGGHDHEVLHQVALPQSPLPQYDGNALRESMRQCNMDQAEKQFAVIAQGKPADAFDELQPLVQDQIDVHRVVLAWRAWETLNLTGIDHAHTLLRQSVRYCVAHETEVLRRNRSTPEIRTVLPQVIDQFQLASKQLGQRRADESWIKKLADVVYRSDRKQAAEAVAQAIAEGIHPEDIGEAITLAANALVLHDPGRPQDWAAENKPAGSVHGDSVGVHASDAANAWRCIARVSSPRNAIASLIVAAYHTAGQTQRQLPQPYPQAEHLEKIKATKPESLLIAIEAAIRSKDQALTCALVHQFGAAGLPERQIFDVLLRFALSEDGALHAEKYYMTVLDDFTRSRPAFRWRHLDALARVTASEYGYPAPGYAQACELLKVN